ncbi:MAG: tetratricopeptide repeat protein, partial [Pseudomonadota bacterium]
IRPEAVTVCNNALREYPHVIRFQVQYARALISTGRSREAVEAISPAADAGYPSAQTSLGEMHAAGQLDARGKADLETAATWFNLAGAQDHPPALVHIASLQASGKGGYARSDDAAASTLRTAAEAGHPPAQTLLGQRFSSGKGVTRSYENAGNWFTPAANAGYADAQFLLAELYERGRGVTKDKAEAARWFEKARDNGHPDAAARLRRLQ